MPSYDFRCLCGHEFEARGGYETADLPCPECGEAANRLAVNEITFVVN